MSWPTRRRFLAWVAALTLGIAAGIMSVLALGVASHELLSQKRLTAVATDAVARGVIPSGDEYDNFTECGVLIMIALRRPELLHDILDTRFALDFAYPTCRYLTERALTGTANPIVSYINYPFASRHLEAIILSALNFDTARHLYGAVSYGAVLALVLASWFAAPSVAGILTPVFAMLLFAFGLDRFGPHLAHAPGIFIGIGGLAIMVAARERLQGIRARLAVFGFLGVLVAAFDILNGAIPAVLSLAIIVNHFFFARDNLGDRPWQRAILQAASIPVCFLAGYVALSAGRLLAIELLYGLDWEPYRKAISVRLGSKVGGGESIGLIDIVQNFWLWRGQLTFGHKDVATGISIAALLALTVSAFAFPAIIRIGDKRKTAFLIDLTALFFASSVIIGWYFTFPNHSYVHPWLMGRLAALPMAYCFATASLIMMFLARQSSSPAGSLRLARNLAARLWPATHLGITRTSDRNETAGRLSETFLQQLSRALNFTAPNALSCAYLVCLSLIYIFVYVHTPLSLFFAPHDDTLFAKLGQYIAEGKWLGPFDQFTLMKGPGYPLFLALANWIGISVSIAHAVFHCVATGFFVAVCHRFIKSHLISALHFALLLWHPLFLSIILLRVIRDAIYTDQVFLFLSFFILLLFCAPDIRRRVTFGIAAGLALGWIWLTREEGVWLLPGIAVLSAGALIRDVRVGRVRTLMASLAIFLVTLGATQVALHTVNRIAYGKFIGVDFKEKNFQRALAAIHSVVSGGTQHYVSVTRSAREQIYRVSPTFATLSRYLDVPPDQGWGPAGCAVIPSTCGEIASGWFMWALRDGAQALGNYKSPGRASVFFGLIADEITAACAQGELKCEPQLFAEMPHITWSDFANVPSLYLESLNYLLLLNPPPQLGTSFGHRDIPFQSMLRFLNYPLYGKREGEAQRSDHYEIIGWYLTSGSEWFTASVKDSTGLSGGLQVERRASPEFAEKSPPAPQQRFALNIHCSDDCILRVEAADGAAVEKRLGDFRRRSTFATPVGRGTFYVESVEVLPNPNNTSRVADKIAQSIREFVLKNYKFVFVPVLALGLVAFLASLFFWRKAVTNGCYIIAFACLTLVFVRLTVLVLITATSMFALHGNYHGPACSLLVSATVVSIAAFLQLAGYGAPRNAVKRV